MECVKTVSYSILLNGKPTSPVQAIQGLRQGDPLSITFSVCSGHGISI